MATPNPEPQGSTGRPMRMEIGVVLLIVLIALVAGGLFVLFTGSPTKDRQVLDSSNSLPAGRTAPPSPNVPAPVKP